jgi:carboxyl-terminal processing protease
MEQFKRFKAVQMVAVLAFVLIVLISCKKEETVEATPKDGFYNLLRREYFWNQHIPEIKPSRYKDLPEILEAIRYMPKDRYSFVTDWDYFYNLMMNSEIVGFGFNADYDSKGNLRVLLCFDSTDMYKAGVRRGWIIKAINNTPVTPGSNFRSLLGENTVGVTREFTFENPEGNIVKMEFTKKVVNMNTVLHQEIIQEGGLKIGYLVYNSFTAPSLQELEPVFARFKSENVSELILDLRYNGGGSASVALNLGSLIGGQKVIGKSFASFTFNDNQKAKNSSLIFPEKTSSIEINRLVTICTDNTASASELIINGLKPFMDVHIVGSTTYGKPVGFELKKLDKWAICITNFECRNALGSADYYDGFTPNFPAEDGMEYDFGDRNEPSLKRALAFITGGVAKSAPVTVPKDTRKENWQLIRVY